MSNSVLDYNSDTLQVYATYQQYCLKRGIIFYNEVVSMVNMNSLHISIGLKRLVYLNKTERNCEARETRARYRTVYSLGIFLTIRGSVTYNIILIICSLAYLQDVGYVKYIILLISSMLLMIFLICGCFNVFYRSISMIALEKKSKELCYYIRVINGA